MSASRGLWPLVLQGEVAELMLNPYRRHSPDCPHRSQGKAWVKCSCPIWCSGEWNGKRRRFSLRTRDWQRALRRLVELEQEQHPGPERKSVSEAATAFLAAKEGVAPATVRKYRRVLQRLGQFASGRGILTLDALTLQDLDAYRKSRKLKPLTWSKELQLLRQFFSFAQRRKWCAENPAKDMEMPPNPKPAPREPYTAEEIRRILEACDNFGRGPYERLRARAAILLLRYYGLRVSDVATLEKSRIRDGQIFLHALKNGVPLWLPLYAEVQFALECLPAPRGAPADCPYFFWSGLGTREGHIKTFDRMLKAVFAKSGVVRAHAHRFRHTLATEILANGGSLEDAANILGDSPAIIRKHYLRWSPAYQQRTVEVLTRVHGTNLVQREIAAPNPLPVNNIEWCWRRGSNPHAQ